MSTLRRTELRIVPVLILLVALTSCGSRSQPSLPRATTPASSLPPSTTVETATTTQQPSPSTTAQPTTTTTPALVHEVTPGAFCSPEGSTGVTKKGVTVTCKGPTPFRWRS